MRPTKPKQCEKPALKLSAEAGTVALGESSDNFKDVKESARVAVAIAIAVVAMFVLVIVITMVVPLHCCHCQLCMPVSLSACRCLSLSLSRLALFHIIVCLWTPSAHPALYAFAAAHAKSCRRF